MKKDKRKDRQLQTTSPIGKGEDDEDDLGCIPDSFFTMDVEELTPSSSTSEEEDDDPLGDIEGVSFMDLFPNKKGKDDTDKTSFNRAQYPEAEEEEDISVNIGDEELRNQGITFHPDLETVQNAKGIHRLTFLPVPPSGGSEEGKRTFILNIDNPSDLDEEEEVFGSKHAAEKVRSRQSGRELGSSRPDNTDEDFHMSLLDESMKKLLIEKNISRYECSGPKTVADLGPDLCYKKELLSDRRDYNTENKEFLYIKLSVANPQHIRDISVMEVTETEPFEKDGVTPKIGGVLDERLGQTMNRRRCPTCKKNREKCTGHFGFYELPVAVIHTGHIDTILKFLSCFCFKCKEPLFDLPGDELLSVFTASQLFKMACSSAKRAKNQTCKGCLEVQPSFKKSGFKVVKTPPKPKKAKRAKKKKSIDKKKKNKNTGSSGTGSSDDEDESSNDSDSDRAKKGTSLDGEEDDDNDEDEEEEDDIDESEKGYDDLDDPDNRQAILKRKKLMGSEEAEEDPSSSDDERENDDDDYDVEDQVNPLHKKKTTDNSSGNKKTRRHGDAFSSPSGEEGADDIATIPKRRKKSELGKKKFFGKSNKKAKKKGVESQDKKKKSEKQDYSQEGDTTQIDPRDETLDRGVDIDELYEKGIDNSYLTPDDVFGFLEEIDRKYYRYMGFKDKSAHSSLSDMVITTLCIPPLNIRPSTIVGDKRMENGLTLKLFQIMKICGKIKEAQARKKKYYLYRDLAANLQIAVSDYFKDNWRSPSINKDKTPATAAANAKRQQASSNEGQGNSSYYGRLYGKTGRFRGNLQGTRVNGAARTVITPGPDLDIDEVGVPVYVCVRLCYPEKVTAYNFERLKRCVSNGPYIHPGALKVESPSGQVIDLKYDNTFNPDVMKGEEGWKVHRHLRNGDVVIMNRQPTLHKMSMYGHRVRVIDELCFRLNDGVDQSYNADHDGDEMNMHTAGEEMSKSELHELMRVNKNLVSPGINTIRVSLQQDGTLGNYDITKKDTFLNEEEAVELLLRIKRKLSPAKEGVLRVSNFDCWDKILKYGLKESFNSSEEKCNNSPAWRRKALKKLNRDNPANTPSLNPKIDELKEKEKLKALLPEPCVLLPSRLWTGKQIWSMMLPGREFSPPSEQKGRTIAPISSVSGEKKGSKGDILSFGQPGSGGVNIRPIKDSFKEYDQFESQLVVMQNEGFYSMNENERTIAKERIVDFEKRVQEYRNTWFHPEDRNLVIRNGELLLGCIDKKRVAVSPHSLQHWMLSYYGGETSMKFLRRIQALSHVWLEMRGFACKLEDVFVPEPERLENRRMVIKAGIKAALLYGTSSMNDAAYKNIIHEPFVVNMRRRNHRASSSPENSIDEMKVSGGKGNDTTTQQMMTGIGPMQIGGKMITGKLRSGRAHAFFKPGDPHPEARGTIMGAIIGGLQPHDSHYNSAAGRVGIVDTAVKTSETGYLQRKLVKITEDLIPDYYGTIRNSKREIVQVGYGGDLCDPSKIVHASSKTLLQTLNKEELRKKYAWTPEGEDSITNTRGEIVGKGPGNQCRNIDEYEFILKIWRKIKERKIPEEPAMLRLPFDIPILIPMIQGACRPSRQKLEARINQDKMSFKTDRDKEEWIKQTLESEGKDRGQSPPTIKECWALLSNFFERIKHVSTFRKSEKHDKKGARETLHVMTHVIEYLSSKPCILEYKLSTMELKTTLNHILEIWEGSQVDCADAVGVVLAQSIGEPATQMTLNTFHFAGQESIGNAMNGLAKVKHVTGAPQKPHPSYFVRFSVDPCKANTDSTDIGNRLDEMDRMSALHKGVFAKIEFNRMIMSLEVVEDVLRPSKGVYSKMKGDRDFIRLFCETEDIEERGPFSPYVIRMNLNMEITRKMKLSDEMVMNKLRWSANTDGMNELFSGNYSGKPLKPERLMLLNMKTFMMDGNPSKDGQKVVRFYIQKDVNSPSANVAKDHDDDEEGGESEDDEEQEEGSSKKKKRSRRVKKKKDPKKVDQEYKRAQILHKFFKAEGFRLTTFFQLQGETYPKWVADVGSKKDLLKVEACGIGLKDACLVRGVKKHLLYSNSIREVERNFGIIPTRLSIYEELIEAMSIRDSLDDKRHLSLLCHQMTKDGNIMGIHRDALARVCTSPFRNATFEKPYHTLMTAAEFDYADPLNGISERIITNFPITIGTGSSDFAVVKKTNYQSPQKVSQSMRFSRQMRKKKTGSLPANIVCQLFGPQNNQSTNNSKLTGSSSIIGKDDDIIIPIRPPVMNVQNQQDRNINGGQAPWGNSFLGGYMTQNECLSLLSKLLPLNNAIHDDCYDPSNPSITANTSNQMLVPSPMAQPINNAREEEYDPRTNYSLNPPSLHQEESEYGPNRAQFFSFCNEDYSPITNTSRPVLPFRNEDYSPPTNTVQPAIPYCATGANNIPLNGNSRQERGEMHRKPGSSFVRSQQQKRHNQERGHRGGQGHSFPRNIQYNTARTPPTHQNYRPSNGGGWAQNGVQGQNNVGRLDHGTTNGHNNPMVYNNTTIPPHLLQEDGRWMARVATQRLESKLTTNTLVESMPNGFTGSVNGFGTMNIDDAPRYQTPQDF